VVRRRTSFAFRFGFPFTLVIGKQEGFSSHTWADNIFWILRNLIKAFCKNKKTLFPEIGCLFLGVLTRLHFRQLPAGFLQLSLQLSDLFKRKGYHNVITIRKEKKTFERALIFWDSAITLDVAFATGGASFLGAPRRDSSKVDFSN
jgi:hypothetical protein